MRAAMAIISMGLVLGLAYRAGLAQTGTSSPSPCPTFRGACDVPALEAVRMIALRTGWATTRGIRPDAVLYTTDGGSHWKDVTPPNSPGRWSYRITFVPPDTLWAMPYNDLGPTTTIFRTTDGGAAWKSIAVATPNAGTAASITFINPREGWLLTGLGCAMGRCAAEVYRSTDSGETWIKIAAWEASLTENITFVDPSTGWATAWDARGPSSAVGLSVTHDGGRTWRWQNLPLPSGLTPAWMYRPRAPQFFTARDGIFPVFFSLLSDASQQKVVRMFAVVYTTHDGGTIWTPTRPVSIASRDDPYCFVDTQHGWVSDGDTLFTTSDSGRSWMTLQPTGPFADVKQLEFVSEQVGWALSRISPYLLRTQNGGRAWIPVTYAISR